MKKPYFPSQKNAPLPLRSIAKRVVRFEEVDPLGIVWHGRYPSYLEDGREMLGNQYGLGYADFYKHGIAAPIKKMHLDYHRPLRFADNFTIEAVLHWSDAARLNYEFILRNANAEITTTGYSVQLFMDSNASVLLLPPPLYETFRNRWQAGEFS